MLPHATWQHVVEGGTFPQSSIIISSRQVSFKYFEYTLSKTRIIAPYSVVARMKGMIAEIEGYY